MAKSQQLAIPDLGIQIVEDTTLTRLETMKSFFQLSVSGKSRLFWTQEGSPAGRKRNSHESLPGHRMPTANLSCFRLLTAATHTTSYARAVRK